MRRRFVLVALAVGVLVTLAWAVPLAAVAYSSARDNALFVAERDVEALAGVVRVTTDGADLGTALGALPPDRRDKLTLTLPDGQVLGVPGHGSAAAYATARATGSAVTVEISGGYVYLRPVGETVIESYVPTSVINQRLRMAWGLPVLFGIVLLCLACLVAAWMGRRAVQASVALAAAARRLGEGDIEVRVVPDGPPEIATAGKAFNEMAERIRTLLANERELLADLSHRLRTPLTALRLNVEALPAGADRDRVWESALQTERELSAIIEEARRPRADARPTVCDLAEVVAERTAYWAILAADQERVWTVEGLDAEAPVGVSRPELASALDIVLGNVFRHTPPGTAYHVTVVSRGYTHLLVVDDAGPGITTPERLMARGISGTDSTGLGLDIARRVTESTGGSLAVDPGPLGGARVTLTFRVPAA